MKIRAKRFDKSLPLPNYENKASGIDFYCREEIEIQPGEIKLVPLNVALEIPEGTVLFFILRSSTPLKKGLIAPHSVGVLDPFFNGDNDEVMFEFMNVSKETVIILKGEKLVQAVLLKCEKVELEEVNSLGNKGVGGYKMPNENSQ